MTKAEMVDKLAEKGQMTKKLASESLDLVFSAISDVLVAGDEISVPGFGKFSVIVRQARTGLNPRTKEKTQHPGNQSSKVYRSKGPQRIDKVIPEPRGF